MNLTHSDVRKILQILDEASQLEALEVRVGNFVLRACKPGGTLAAGAADPAARTVAPDGQPQAATPARPTSSAAAEVPAGMVAVRAPMVGTFYRRPKPEDPAFVEEGARVSAGAPLALVEAMKLFNTVAAPCAGRVVRIVAADRQLVEREALLVVIEPDA